MSRLVLHLKVQFFRTLQSIFTLFDLYLSHPLPQRVSLTRKIPSSLASIPGTIDLLFYTPSSYTKPRTPNNTLPPTSKQSTKKHPILINLHGGGFTIGHARDDARWASAVTSETNAVVASVNYRLAPTHPFPTAIEDCVSAILWLWRNAEEYNLDISRTAISGFSAGGNLTYATCIRLYEELERLKKECGAEGIEKGRIVSLVVFYGGTDNTLSRAEKDASNLNLIPAIPSALLKIMDESYFYPNPDRASPLLSPGLAPDRLIRNAFPGSLVLINCGGDQLLAESERFRKRLVGLGKNVEGCVVEGVGHAWDKRPTFKKGDVKRDEAYQLGVNSLQEVWE